MFRHLAVSESQKPSFWVPTLYFKTTQRFSISFYAMRHDLGVLCMWGLSLHRGAQGDLKPGVERLKFELLPKYMSNIDLVLVMSSYIENNSVFKGV